MTDNGKVVKSDFDVIERALADRFVLVLSGDVVFDVTKGCNVLSSDVLLQASQDSVTSPSCVILTPGIKMCLVQKSGQLWTCCSIFRLIRIEYCEIILCGFCCGYH